MRFFLMACSQRLSAEIIPRFAPSKWSVPWYLWCWRTSGSKTIAQSSPVKRSSAAWRRSKSSSLDFRTGTQLSRFLTTGRVPDTQMRLLKLTPLITQQAQLFLGSGHELACQCTRARTKTCTVKRNTDLEATIVGKFVVMEPLLDERARRLWAAAESVAIGYGGDALVAAATGVARGTICHG